MTDGTTKYIRKPVQKLFNKGLETKQKHFLLAAEMILAMEKAKETILPNDTELTKAAKTYGTLTPASDAFPEIQFSQEGKEDFLKARNVVLGCYNDGREAAKYLGLDDATYNTVAAKFDKEAAALTNPDNQKADNPHNLLNNLISGRLQKT